jgi:hypothetical protein
MGNDAVVLKNSFLIIALIGLSHSIFAQNFAISVDPITFVSLFAGLLSAPKNENGEQ